MKYNNYENKGETNSQNNQNDYNNYDEEINLKDYIQVILKYWKLISVIFLISVITAVSIFIFEPNIYYAETTILITPSKIRYSFSTSEAFSSEEKIDGFETSESTISVPTHKELLKSNIVMQKIIDKLNLTNQSEKKLTPYDLSKNLEIETSEDTSIIKLIAKNNNPVLVRDIVNTWAVEYIEYSQDII